MPNGRRSRSASRRRASPSAVAVAALVVVAVAVEPAAAAGGWRWRGGGFVFGGGNPAFEDCLPARFQEFQAQFTVPLQTINQVVNPPSTDITNTSYTAAGVDPTNPNVGLITAAQVTTGRWFAKSATGEVLVNVGYASSKKLAVGDTLPINGTKYKIVGLVKPTLAGNTFDVYFPLAAIQKLASKPNRVTQILVKASSSGDVDKVAAAIRKQLPGAEVVTSKSLADQVTGKPRRRQEPSPIGSAARSP